MCPCLKVTSGLLLVKLCDKALVERNMTYNAYLTFQPQVIDPLLKDCIGEFLQTLQDPDLNVRRVALVTFNSAAHNKPPLIRDLLESMLPHLYNETKVRVCSIGACRIYSEIMNVQSNLS